MAVRRSGGMRLRRRRVPALEAACAKGITFGKPDLLALRTLPVSLPEKASTLKD